MSFYKHHVFFCTNQRTDGRASCQDHQAQEMRDYLKKKIKEYKLNGPNGVRINNAGCLDRCGLGPILVIYPDETWYRYQSKSDIDEIFEQHLQYNEKVERLIV
ncbi:MAG: 2Fe-2S ferredoxin [Cycloclasticus sp.]|nr:2Fe-2S ferredoxin [Cycloclasticus sp.]MBG96133.1 2Fe-2S ferredoxin [Cycloclasticus sp.]HAI95878.1 2Fe-2S ferredoxin [Methylococcaceae bacterium]|tara:strand:+ start:357 stop:665 length:309 start_codon:yes stop_codon:yes gene_type:complete